MSRVLKTYLKDRKTPPFIQAALLLSLHFIHAAYAAEQPPDAPGGTNFFFVQISDTHIGVSDSDRRVERIVKAVNGLPLNIEFTAVTGDITSDNITRKEAVAEGISALRNIEYPVHYVAGNHDINRTNFQETAGAYTNYFGPLVTSAEYHGVVCIFAYTEPLAKDFSPDGYDPLREIRRKLEEAEGKPVLLFHHTPSVEDFYDNAIHPGWNQENRSAWKELINSHNVKAVITGHFHRDELHRLGTVPVFVCSSSAGFWGRQASFRIYEYRNGVLTYRTQYR